MSETKAGAKIDFRPITLEDKATYERALAAEQGRGCEFSFANLFLWGRQKMAEIGDTVVLFSQFNRRSVYPFPLGTGDKRVAVDAIIADAQERGISCRITGMNAEAVAFLQEQYPDRFLYHCDEGSFDYVYDINDLADLKGKKYHGKRNHLNRFEESYPNARVEAICDANIEAVREMVADWYAERLAADPHADFAMEQVALARALADYEALGMEGLVLLDGARVLAVTLGSRLSADTFDVQFEKARADVNGAYPAINRAFARYIREKYPDILYLDREEDMGIEGLRRAKQSYYPHHMVEKCWAHLREDGYPY